MRNIYSPHLNKYVNSSSDCSTEYTYLQQQRKSRARDGKIRDFDRRVVVHMQALRITATLTTYGWHYVMTYLSDEEKMHKCSRKSYRLMHHLCDDRVAFWFRTHTVTIRPKTYIFRFFRIQLSTFLILDIAWNQIFRFLLIIFPVDLQSMSLIVQLIFISYIKVIIIAAGSVE